MLPSDGEFYHYALGRLGSSGGHLDPKKKGRTVCELFGAYGWGFGVREMKHLLDHLLSRGVNRLVPHAFSIAEYPDPECPPHFYARGHNPEYPYFAELMRYAGRMCGQLSDGQHEASVAVLYDGEMDWPGTRMPMQKVCRALTEAQVSFDIVCMDMLRDLAAYGGSLSGEMLTINGVRFDALLIPGAEYAPASLLSIVKEAPDFPVFFVGEYPKAFLKDGAAVPGGFATSGDISTGIDRDGAPSGGAASAAASCAACKAAIPVISLEEIPSALDLRELRPVQVSPAFAGLSIYSYLRPDGRRYFLLNESPDLPFEGTVRLPAAQPLARYDGFADRCESLDIVLQDGTAELQLQLEPGESCLLIECVGDASMPCQPECPAASSSSCCSENPDASLPRHRWARELSAACDETLALSDGWKIRCIDTQGQTVLDEPAALAPISDRLPAFSGTIIYERELTLDQVPATALFRAEHVYDVMRLSVNGEDAGCLLTPPWQIEISGLLKAGTNTLRVEAATTPARDQFNYPSPPFDFSIDPVEPTGMFGNVELLMKGTGK